MKRPAGFLHRNKWHLVGAFLTLVCAAGLGALSRDAEFLAPLRNWKSTHAGGWHYVLPGVVAYCVHFFCAVFLPKGRRWIRALALSSTYVLGTVFFAVAFMPTTTIRATSTRDDRPQKRKATAQVDSISPRVSTTPRATGHPDSRLQQPSAGDPLSTPASLDHLLIVVLRLARAASGSTVLIDADTAYTVTGDPLQVYETRIAAGSHVVTMQDPSGHRVGRQSVTVTEDTTYVTLHL